VRATLSVVIALTSALLVLVGLRDARASDQLEPRGRIIFEGCAEYCGETDTRANRADLYALDLRTGKRSRITRTPGFESEPAVSTNGVWLAYSLNDEPGAIGETHQLWLSRVDGSLAMQLTPNGGVSTNPTWFMNDLVYFTRADPQGCSSVFRIAKRGGSPELVIRQRGDESVFQPSVAPDGHVAYGSADCEVRLDCCYLEVVDSRGRKTNDLAKLPRFLEAPGRPAWSPDGRMIAFQTGYDPGVVWVARRDGSQMRRISPRTLSASSPTWSPDGKWIAFDALSTAARAPYATDIYVARVDGSNLRRLTRTRTFSESSAAWTR
jgi:Tol biopolymer transport system component